MDDAPYYSTLASLDFHKSSIDLTFEAWLGISTIILGWRIAITEDQWIYEILELVRKGEGRSKKLVGRQSVLLAFKLTFA